MATVKLTVYLWTDGAAEGSAYPYGQVYLPKDRNPALRTILAHRDPHHSGTMFKNLKELERAIRQELQVAGIPLEGDDG